MGAKFQKELQALRVVLDTNTVISVIVFRRGRLAWIRDLWPGKLIIKGILDRSDAREAVQSGADALVVSNHGGRQLDGAPSSISVLPEIVQEVGAETELIFDGGIRSGQDVVRALALGAKSCMIGRSYVYGLGADGQRGVETAVQLIGREMTTTMGLCGVNRIDQIDASVLRNAPEAMQRSS